MRPAAALRYREPFSIRSRPRGGPQGLKGRAGRDGQGPGCLKQTRAHGCCKGTLSRLPDQVRARVPRYAPRDCEQNHQPVPLHAAPSAIQAGGGPDERAMAPPLIFWPTPTRGRGASTDDVFFFRQQNSLFRQLCCFFAKWGLFVAKWGLFFANFFDHARVLYSEPSASDRSISR